MRLAHIPGHQQLNIHGTDLIEACTKKVEGDVVVGALAFPRMNYEHDSHEASSAGRFSAPETLKICGLRGYLATCEAEAVLLLSYHAPCSLPKS